jgi:UDP-N-acetylmuramoyl-tripeptide--D-alanyl-D-alanine ligase
MQIEDLYKIYLQHPSVQTDTRKIKEGDIFFALKGGNFNGNTFAQKAIDAGAAYTVIDDAAFEISCKTILVADVLTALQQLAKHHREQFSTLPTGRQVPFIAITGSNGKTTTKELVHTVLSAQYITYATEGNLNNHIGIPLTILKIKPDAEIAIIEMGANHQKEIESYCEYALPTHGIITNCGKAHLEGFGGIEGVRKGKGELFDYLRSNNGTAFVMWDYDYLQDMSKGITSIVKYATANADVEGKVIKSEPFLEVGITKGIDTDIIKTQLVGDYNLPNVLVAVATGKHFNVPPDSIQRAIENYSPSNSRSQLVEKGSNKIILDAYNANPSSMTLAIENFSKLHASNKVLMLGGMAELGDESLNEHKAIVELISQTQWGGVVLVGGDFLKFTHPYISFANATEAKEWLQRQHFEDTHLLIKGSRSMQMEKVLDN